MAESSFSVPTIEPEVVKQRLEAYERQTKPLSDYYRRQGVLETVDGACQHGRREPQPGKDRG